MQKTHDIEIDENDNIFKNDLLDRKSEIENLTPIVLNFNDPLVLALDSPWGTGKTTFVKLWQAYLKKGEDDKPSMQSIYFNAWETDFAEDPLIVLVSEFDKWLKATNNESKITNWSRGLKTVFPELAKRSAVVATKMATFGSLDIGAEYERTAAEFTGNVTSDLLDQFYKESKSIQLFKNIIGDALKALPEGQKNLVIFIDELDRCRPTYAIELLERIKHLFSIERLVFVLSTDTVQLSHSIQAVYGNNFDAKKYLQRFIDLDYSLKEPELEKYIEAQFKSLKISDYFRDRNNIRNEQENLKGCLFFLAKRFSLKLREINLILMRIRLILCSVTGNNYLDETLLVTLLFIREYKKELYDKYIESPIVAKEIIKFIAQYLTPEEKQTNYFYGIVAYLIAPINYRSETINIKEFVNNLEEVGDDGKIEIINITHAVTSQNSGNGISHKPTIERIELLHRINM